MRNGQVPHGYFRLALASPYLALGQPQVNAQRQIRLLRDLASDQPDLVVFPPLALTGVSLGDLNLQADLLADADEAEAQLAKQSDALSSALLSSRPYLATNGLSLRADLLDQSLSRAAWQLPVVSQERGLAAFAAGPSTQLLANKTFSPEAKEALSESPTEAPALPLAVFTLAPGLSLLASEADKKALAGGLALVYDLEAARLGQRAEIRAWAKSFSRTYACAVAYSSPSAGESSADGSYSGYRLIAEAGEILAESALYSSDTLIVDIDLDYLSFLAAQQKNSFAAQTASRTAVFAYSKAQSAEQANKKSTRGRAELAGQKDAPPKLLRQLDPLPFLPQQENTDTYYAEALELLSQALIRRMRQLPAAKLILGLSGGLDSTLALLLAIRALDKLDRPRKDLIAVNMPGPGSHERSKNNAESLAVALGVTYRVITIDEAIEQHLQAIGHPAGSFDLTFENAQARERTQILMDLANLEQGMVLGTGDLSELALGWCTYNGDQMSMYNLNATVPKTLVRALCQYEAERYAPKQPQIAELLFDVIATPVSPELLPRSDEAFTQKTEDILGPYELHDFFLWHLVKRGAGPQKILQLALLTFQDQYQPDFILQTLETFLCRFPQQQFKRSASPEGASLGLVSLSPRKGYILPSDLAANSLTHYLDQ
ncbi:MAG: NAD(+) synthase [Eubacteriales bacterium]|nr:NAD(+) synthase [Eubacteriales bacterium]